MTGGYVFGYDPGGNGAHGVALVPVRFRESMWVAGGLRTATVQSVAAAIAWFSRAATDGAVIAAGIDTLTEWSSGKSGLRPADRWLREIYPDVRNSVMAPNSIASSMTVSGASFLTLMGPRFHADETTVTEAHPKVCYYALTQERHSWAAERKGMASWLAAQLGIETEDALKDPSDDAFDAALAALAALRGVNREWALDLHALDYPEGEARVRFCGPTHFWWPPVP